jgi:hypothetical protein
MYDVVVIETAEHMDDGIALADITQELIAEAFAFGGALHQSGDIYDFAGGGNNAAGMHELG